MKKQEYKECPFCGSKQTFLCEYGYGKAAIICNSCNATGPLMDTVRKAINAWSRRKDNNKALPNASKNHRNTLR